MRDLTLIVAPNVGSNAMDASIGRPETGALTKEFFDHASEPKEFVEIECASHVSLYDIPEDVDRATAAMDAFFRNHVGALKAAA